MYAVCVRKNIEEERLARVHLPPNTEMAAGSPHVQLSNSNLVSVPWSQYHEILRVGQGILAGQGMGCG